MNAQEPSVLGYCQVDSRQKGTAHETNEVNLSISLGIERNIAVHGQWTSLQQFTW